MYSPSQSNAVLNAAITRHSTSIQVNVSNFPLANDLYNLSYVRSTLPVFSFGVYGGGSAYGMSHNTETKTAVSHTVTVFEKMGGIKFSWSFNETNDDKPIINTFHIYSGTPHNVENDLQKVKIWKPLLLDLLEFEFEVLLGAPIGNINFDELMEQPDHVTVQIAKPF